MMTARFGLGKMVGRSISSGSGEEDLALALIGCWNCRVFSGGFQAAIKAVFDVF